MAALSQISHFRREWDQGRYQPLSEKNRDAIFQAFGNIQKKNPRIRIDRQTGPVERYGDSFFPRFFYLGEGAASE